VTTGAELLGQVGFGDRAFILRADAAMLHDLGDDPVPFHALLDPAARDLVRGLPRGVRRGRAMAGASLEYRWMLSPIIDAALFVDYGGAFGENFDGVGRDRLVASTGFTLRFFNLHRWRTYRTAPLIGTVSIAWSEDDGVRLLLSAGP
jgi:hypothetical protein